MTPCAVSQSSFDGPAIPSTVAPARLASWTAMVPTPPAAPATATVSPGFNATARTAAYAVVPATYKLPATCHDTSGGLAVSCPAGTTTNCAWLARLSVKPSTSSPTPKVSTPSPTSASPPAISLPCPDGNVAGQRSCIAPRRIIASPGLIAAAFTSTRTSPAAGTGFGTSRTSKTSASPYRSNCTALLIRATTASARELFRPWHDAHADPPCGQEVGEHLGQHGQFGVVVPRQELADPPLHLVVHAFVYVDDDPSVGREAKGHLLAVSRNRRA